ncbi:hypothetical protein BTO06_15785 [Tenacibaculum sp. SZ-18]|uniref:hypothetical protein n=1 Tax=Tenacibaculum sp. SZ-18 TaxID=754423 RepID=UPI000C2D6799|nr:hypothetical protein [Tenacibaculum sp. SZ-18]AUC16521.1 hypothetical protein BTO06_15785 [Tenacibaculum sp. SZ-18]
MNLEDIRENYKKFDDWKIEKLATEEADSLRPEVVDILKSEIKKRNLNHSLINSVDSLTKKITDKDLNQYYEILKNHPCPKCKSKKQKINATFVGQVISIFVITNYDKSIRIACSDCLDIMHKKANIKSLLLGWWGIPWGPINTIRSLIFNFNMKKYNRTESQNEILVDFIIDNVGIMERAKTEPEKLTDFIIRINNTI